jgi:hypothetical protein
MRVGEMLRYRGAFTTRAQRHRTQRLNHLLHMLGGRGVIGVQLTDPRHDDPRVATHRLHLQRTRSCEDIVAVKRALHNVHAAAWL